MPFRYRGNRWIGVHIDKIRLKAPLSNAGDQARRSHRLKMVFELVVSERRKTQIKSRAIPAGVSFRRLFAVVAAVAGSFAAVFAALAVVTALAIFTLAIRVVAFSHLVSPVKFIDNLNIMRKQRFVNRVKQGIL